MDLLTEGERNLSSRVVPLSFTIWAPQRVITTRAIFTHQQRYYTAAEALRDSSTSPIPLLPLSSFPKCLVVTVSNGDHSTASPFSQLSSLNFRTPTTSFIRKSPSL